MKNDDITRIARTAVQLGTELEDKGARVLRVLEGWEEGPRPAPAETGAEVCTVHEDGVLLETGAGRCDEACDSRECIGAPLYRRAAR